MATEFGKCRFCGHQIESGWQNHPNPDDSDIYCSEECAEKGFQKFVLGKEVA